MIFLGSMMCFLGSPICTWGYKPVKHWSIHFLAMILSAQKAPFLAISYAPWPFIFKIAPEILPSQKERIIFQLSFFWGRGKGREDILNFGKVCIPSIPSLSRVSLKRHRHSCIRALRAWYPGSSGLPSSRNLQCNQPPFASPTIAAIPEAATLSNRFGKVLFPNITCLVTPQ